MRCRGLQTERLQGGFLAEEPENGRRDGEVEQGGGDQAANNADRHGAEDLLAGLTQ